MLKDRDKPIHVMHLTPHFYWPQLASQGWPVKFDTMGGMQSQLFRQVNELSEAGVTQTIVTLKIPHTPTVWEMNNLTKVLGVRIPLCPIRSRIRGLADLNISWFLGVLQYLIKAKPHCDVIHVHCSGVSAPLLISILAAKILKKPYILTIHCSALATYKPLTFLDKILLHPLSKQCEKYALKKAHRCIFLTDRSRNFCVPLVKGLDKKSLIIPDSIDFSNFRARATCERVKNFIEHYSVPQNIPIVAYIGRIAREKGWTDIIALAAKSRAEDFHCLIVGDGNECQQMRALAKKLHLEHRFTFTGYISQEMVPTAFKVSTVIILPSQHEEFGGVLLEAMAMGIPSVAYAVGGVSKVLEDKKTGLLVTPGSTDEMLEKILCLLNNKKLYNSIQENALKFVSEKYDVKRVCADLLTAYGKTMHSPKQ